MTVFSFYFNIFHNSRHSHLLFVEFWTNMSEFSKSKLYFKQKKPQRENLCGQFSYRPILILIEQVHARTYRLIL